MSSESLLKAVTLLKQGEVVAIPTETVYGLAANALDPLAVTKIFAAKERPTFNPLIVHLSKSDDPANYVKEFTRSAQLLADKFWPGPLSILLTKKQVIPEIVTSGMDSVVLRKPAHPITQELLELLPFPLAAPSANKFKQISPTTAEHVRKSLKDEVAYIIDGGKATIGVESTIVDCRSERVVILRHGGVSKEEIEAVVGEVDEAIKEHSNPLAPGQLDKHYATVKPLILSNDIDSELAKHLNKKISLILWDAEARGEHTYSLSKDRNLLEAASNLFGMMHEADQDSSELIIAQQLPEKGLGRAINDRLKRASHR